MFQITLYGLTFEKFEKFNSCNSSTGFPLVITKGLLLEKCIFAPSYGLHSTVPHFDQNMFSLVHIVDRNLQSEVILSLPNDGNLFIPDSKNQENKVFKIPF